MKYQIKKLNKKNENYRINRFIWFGFQFFLFMLSAYEKP